MYYQTNTSLQKGIILVNKLTEKQHCINIIIIKFRRLIITNNYSVRFDCYVATDRCTMYA